jgi:ABC-type phosphonate transport system ATPase subunit
MQMVEDEVLRATALTKSYAGVRVLRNCSFDLRRGEALRRRIRNSIWRQSSRATMTAMRRSVQPN